MKDEPQRRQPGSTADEGGGVTEKESTASSRRGFLCASARKVAYVAPMVLLFRPNQACAASHSTS